MWQAFFLAIGISLCILGGECLVIDKAVLAGTAAAEPKPFGALASASSTARSITPPEWAPWSLLSSGAVVILYSFTIPRRAAG